MNLPSAIPEEELLLAQLAAAKLARIIQGTISVGVASLELDSPEDFLAGKDKAILAFIEVLRCVAVKPECADEVELLRKHAQQLPSLAHQFYKDFLNLANWRTLSPQEIRISADHLVISYTQLCQSLGEFRMMLGTAQNALDQVRQGRSLIEGFLKLVLRPVLQED